MQSYKIPLPNKYFADFVPGGGIISTIYKGR